MAGEFKKFVVIQWTAKGKEPVAIPVHRITEQYENMLVKRARAFRKGVKLDNTAREGLVWDLESIYFNGSLEPGIPETENYPEALNAFCSSVEVEDTGTLQLPRRGLVRAQLKSYRCVADAEMEDAETLTCTFWEDNEDTTTNSAFKPAAHAAAAAIAQQCVNECMAAGVWSDDVSTLAEFASALEGLAAAPLEYVDDLNAQANAVVTHIGRIQNAFANNARAGTSEAAAVLLRPENSLAGRLLRRLGDTAARAVVAPAGEDEITERSFDRALSIFQIAVLTGQPVSTLLRINSQLANGFYIPKGTRVRVHAA